MICASLHVGKWHPFLTLFVISIVVLPVRGESVTLEPIKDTTLYEYHADDPSTALNSNGSGDFFSAGRSLQRSQIRRGLLQFDLGAIPQSAVLVEGSIYLDLYVVDVPRKDASPRPIWLVAAPLADWGEGASATNAGVSGAGSGAPAELGDATWFHTRYDPAIHDGTSFEPGGTGFWQQPGALGDQPLDPWSLYGDPAGIVASEVGPIRLTGRSLEDDLRAWLAGAPQAGWIVVGDERITGDDQSSLRGFASREHLNVNFRPQLYFEYLPGPLAGDFSQNGLLDEADLTLLTVRTRDGYGIEFDLNHDGALDEQDRRVWVEQLKSTWFGDANLDGEFNSADFTSVFQVGEYEDAVPENSTWSEGDWSGDFEFDSNDFVIAFQHGGYELGPRTDPIAVPEPAAWILISTALLRFVPRRQRRMLSRQRYLADGP
jgi:hypothetical protein